METYDLPPVPSGAEREELSTLTAFLRHEATGTDDSGTDDQEWKLRLAELVDLHIGDAEAWEAFLRDLTEREDGSTSPGFVAVVFPLLAAITYFVAQAAGTYAGVVA